MLHADAAKDVPSVEVIFFELLAAEPAPLVVASPKGTIRRVRAFYKKLSLLTCR